MMAKIKVIETDEAPVCPYCEKEPSEVHENTKQESLVERHNPEFLGLSIISTFDVNPVVAAR